MTNAPSALAGVAYSVVGYQTEGDDHLGEQAARKRDAGDGKGDRVDRVRVNNGLNVRALAVGFQVQQDFG